MNRTGAFFTAVTLLFSLNSFSDDISLGTPGYAGSGCPSGSASATLSPDKKSLSVLFDSYVAEAGMTTHRPVDRKACNLAVPIHIPQGYSVAVFQVDYRGFNSVPVGANTRFNVEYFFAGTRGPSMSRMFRGPLNSDYIITNNVIGQALVWSPCGADTNIRINSSIMASTNSNFDQTIATVDSADLTTGLIYHIQWRRCQ